MKLNAILCASTCTLSSVPAPSAGVEPRLFGLELQVEDVAASTRAWGGVLACAPTLEGGEFARLDEDGLALVFVRSEAPRAAEGTAAIGLRMRAPGRDGTTRVDPCDIPPKESELSIAGLDVHLEPCADAGFFERLGIAALHPVPLAIEPHASGPRPRGTRSGVLLLAVERLDPAREALAERGIEVGTARPSPIGRRATVVAPSGLRIDLVERSPAQLAFERIAALAGSWEGKSSQGWTSRSEIEVIARGSAVLERTNFEAHPGETMLTLFHMDGERLLLTHYCVAGNQPRLVASEIDGDRLHFTFLDGTNLPSRDHGHMDEAVLRLEGREAFSSSWSFYRDGKTSWMEEIRYARRGG